ncbi:MAG TPA: RusA family crossover junction endodeoxyribonuclease, partial [Rectinema sp.]|nr:RusA family crossover junction endodeoxyribonuclease [Rectinema sp.]
MGAVGAGGSVMRWTEEQYNDFLRRRDAGNKNSAAGSAGNVENSMEIIVPLIAMGKPRMTRRDKWLNPPRKPVAAYRDWSHKLRSFITNVPNNAVQLDWVAYLPMPKSWSKKKKEFMKGQAHRSKPDKDNIDKAIMDALFERDECIAFGSQSKRWDDGNGPRIIITII